MSLPTYRRRRRRFASWLLVPVALVLAAPARSQTEPARSVDDRLTVPASTTTPAPNFRPGFTSVDRWHLTAAFNAAVERLRRSEICRGLFDNLELEALPALTGTVYEPARGALATARCRGAVVALTVVRGQLTRLCEPFQALSLEDKTSTLIHEALHRAGLGENPPDPAAPTAREIERMVNAACGR